jgi:flavin reductase (NADH)/flavin reductase
MVEAINELVDWRANHRLAAMETVDPQAHRGAMRHFGAAVTVITARDEGIPLGLTATAVCSVTADPPRLVVFINKNTAADADHGLGRAMRERAGGRAGEVAKVFAGMVQGVAGPRFEHGSWGELASGAPVLDGALVSIDCRVAKVFDESTHHAFLCEILATQEKAGARRCSIWAGRFAACRKREG